MDVIVSYPINVKTKLFCACSRGRTCPICDGTPAMLPLLNREALRKAVIAARLLDCRMRVAVFYRIAAVRGGMLQTVLSMRPSPLAEGGSFCGADIYSVYLEEGFTVKPTLAYGLPRLCVRTQQDCSSDLTPLLASHGIISGESEVCLFDERAGITVLSGPVPQGGKPGIYTAEGYFDTAMILQEPELDMCFVHIDSVAADAIFAGDDISEEELGM